MATSMPSLSSQLLTSLVNTAGLSDSSISSTSSSVTLFPAVRKGGRRGKREREREREGGKDRKEREREGGREGQKRERERDDKRERKFMSNEFQGHTKKPLLTIFELSCDSVLALLSVFLLHCVVLCHYFRELSRQRGILYNRTNKSHKTLVYLVPTLK